MNTLNRRVAPLHIRELIEDSGITGELRDFLETDLFFHIEHYKFDEDRILRALQSAKIEQEKGSEEHRITATQGIIAILCDLDIHFSSQEAINCFAATGFRLWADRELEYFDFIRQHAQFPDQDWLSILGNRGLNLCDFLRDDPQSQSNPIHDRIFEGLNRHLDKKLPEDSPLSVYFWLNPELWSVPASGGEDEGDKKSVSHFNECQKIFLKVITQWTSAVLEKNDEDEYYRLLEYLDLRGISRFLGEDELAPIYKSIQERPFELPPRPMAVKDIPLFIRALDREIWVEHGVPPRKPGKDEVEVLHAQLQRIAELCSQDQLKAKLPHAAIKELIPIFQWVPRNYIHNPPVSADQIALMIKFLALMRTRLRMDRDSVQIHDYKKALQHLVKKKQEAQALRQLLITFRNCDYACSDESLNFRPKFERTLFPIPQTFRGLSAEFSISCMIDMVIGSWQIENRRRTLCLDLAEYCMSRLKFKKRSEVKKSTGYYDNEQCTEVSPIWRQAYTEALGELGYALDGNVVRLLDFVRNHDPDETVRNAAHSSYRTIQRERTKKLDDFKGLRAAFWLLRWAQRKHLNKSIDEARAKLLRRQELRDELHTRVTFIYRDFLDPDY